MTANGTKSAVLPGERPFPPLSAFPPSLRRYGSSRWNIREGAAPIPRIRFSGNTLLSQFIHHPSPGLWPGSGKNPSELVDKLYRRPNLTAETIHRADRQKTCLNLRFTILKNNGTQNLTTIFHFPDGFPIRYSAETEENSVWLRKVTHLYGHVMINFCRM